MARKVYILEHLGCANCAAKMEKRILALPGVEDATITYATKQLRLNADDPDALLPKIQSICSSIESEVIVTERKKRTSSRREAAFHSLENHEHGDSCDCGHEHEHAHHEHDDSCGCGHEHEHAHHHHDDSCDCGHEHEHAHHHHEHGDSCGCGHEHEHAHHEHDDSCGCGHDHEHHHHDDSCGCGHEHEHAHHEHDDSCGCGHDHEHAHHHHDDSCDCGHDHEHAHHHHEHDDSCGCGHEHEHAHHEHGNSCNCGHEHHEHDDSCGCGHDHEHAHHHHEHDDSCGCGHEHEHAHHEHGNSCNCGHEHHEHDDSCGCGHDHEHHHHIEEHPADCDCDICHPHEDYCDICGESLSNCTCNMPDATNKKRVFILENLGCANCAAKMESKIKALPEVDYATITFATKQLRISAKDPEALLPTLQSICSSIEPEVIVKPRKHKVQKVESVPEKTIVQPETKPKKSFFCKENMELISIAVGAILFILGEILHEAVFQDETFPPALIALCLIAYIILGWKIILTAIKNLPKGQIFDENFLMTIATLGALAIQNYMEAVGVILFFRIGEYFEHRAVENSRKSIMDAVDMRPEIVHLIVGNQVKIIDAEDAIIGDILLVRPGDRIPLDGIIIEGESQIDTSPVTGEPVPITVHVGDEIVSGCVNNSGLLKMRVEKPLEESMVTRILDSVENAAASKPQMERFITKFARVYTPFVVLMAILTAIIPSLNIISIFPNGGDWNYWIHTALTFLVISCPCALVLSVPLAFFSGLGAGSKKGILFKGGSSLEAIKNITTVIMDKTGTITRGDFRVQKVIPVSTYSETEVLSYCASCELNSTHPIGNSIIEYAKDTNLSIPRPSSVEEIAGKGIKAKLDGKEILCGNRKLMEEYKIDTSKYHDDIFGTEVFIAVDHTFIGYLIIADTIKPESKTAIESINALNIHTVMLTGDGENSAKAVAKETGVKEVHAKLLPQDKVKSLQKIREQEGAVMFVGDGINDAPVLAGADVGAAMGSGADVAIEAADVVFMNSNLTAIPESIQIAKDASNAAMQNVIFALIIKAMVMVLGLTGHANMWFAVFADSGVAVLCVLNSVRILYKYRKKNA